MEKKFEELCNLLTHLFRQLPFPMGGYNKENGSIYMIDNDLRMTALLTKNGYVVVSASGDVYNFSTIAEVESCFLLYFRKTLNSTQQLAKNLGMEF